ncbi:MAG: hypothetical protein E7518_08835 [Ruminococcaceae bacterium]|nr:hypothetical protein [Oscillospiraceae bacterium]
MALYECRNNRGNNSVSDDAFKDLKKNLGRVVTVFTSSGGCTGRGFTGLLVEANDEFIKLVTSLPSAPRHPLGLDSANWLGSDSCTGRLGTSCVIPTNQIVCYAFNQI